MVLTNTETKKDKTETLLTQNASGSHSEDFLGSFKLSGSEGIKHNTVKMESDKISFSHLDSSDSPLYLGLRLDCKEKLQESGQQIKNLKEMLKEANTMCEKQKTQLIETVETFQTKLQNHIVGRHSIMDFRKKEAADQEQMICKLQKTLSQLQNAACTQEMVLLQTSGKLETLLQELQEANVALNQMKDILAREEEHIGKTFIERDITRYKDHGLLIRAMENCLREYNNIIASTNIRFKKIESEFENSRLALQEQKRQLIEDHQERLRKAVTEHEKALAATKEKALHARSQVTNLQQQLNSMEINYQKQIETSNNQIKELDMKLRHKRETSEQEVKIWQDKVQNLTRKMEDLQMHMSNLQDLNKDSERNKIDLETQNDNYQKLMSKLNSDLIFEKKHYKQLFDKEQESTTKICSLEKTLENREMEIKHLEKSIHVLKEENKNLIKSLDQQEQHKTNSKIEVLVKELQSSTDKCNRASQDLVQQQNEINTLQNEVLELKEKLSENKQQLEASNQNYEITVAKLEKKNEESKILFQEHNHFQLLSQQRDQEISCLQEQLSHVTGQISEKNAEASLFRQRCEQLNLQFERKSEGYTILAEEKINLMKKLNDKIGEIEKLRHTLDSNLRKLRLREKRLIDLEEELDKVIGPLSNAEKRLKEFQMAKDNLVQQLNNKTSEYNQLKEERDALRLLINTEKDEKTREINKLEAKLKVQEQDLKIAKQNSSAKDDRATCIVFSLQKQLNEKLAQVENLSTKVKWLEECLDVMKQEKNAMKDEREKLAAMLNKTLINNEKLTNEVNTLSRCDREKKNLIIKLESALEKAARKYASVHSLLEHHEQDINKMKIKYQHNLKELQMTGHNLINHQFSSVKSSPAQLCGNENSSSRSVPLKRPGLLDSRNVTTLKRSELNRPTQSMSAMSDVWVDLKKILIEIQNMTSEPALLERSDVIRNQQKLQENNNSNSLRRSPSEGTVDTLLSIDNKLIDSYYKGNRKSSDSDIYSLHSNLGDSSTPSVVSIETLTTNNVFDKRDIGQEHFSTMREPDSHLENK